MAMDINDANAITGNGDSLSVVLFLVSTAVNFLMPTLSPERRGVRIFLRSITGFLVVAAVIFGIFWVPLTQMLPVVTSSMASLASDARAWFGLLMLMLVVSHLLPFMELRKKKEEERAWQQARDLSDEGGETIGHRAEVLRTTVSALPPQPYMTKVTVNFGPLESANYMQMSIYVVCFQQGLTLERTPAGHIGHITYLRDKELITLDPPPIELTSGLNLSYGKESEIKLRQDVKPDIASEIKEALTQPDFHLEFHFRNLTLNIAGPDSRAHRLTLWDGVNYRRGVAFGRVYNK